MATVSVRVEQTNSRDVLCHLAPTRPAHLFFSVAQAERLSVILCQQVLMSGRSKRDAPATKAVGATNSNRHYKPGISASLTGLPAHIRARIFEMVLAPGDSGRIPVETPWSGIYMPSFGELIGLLPVCKSIHEEASTILYGKNEFEYFQQSRKETDEFEHLYTYPPSMPESFPIVDWLREIGDRNRARVRKIKIHEYTRRCHACHGTKMSHFMEFGHELFALCLAPNCTLEFLPGSPPRYSTQGLNEVYTCHSAPKYELITTTLHALREYAIIQAWVELKLLREVRISPEGLVGELRFKNHKGVEWGLEFRVRHSLRKSIFWIKKEPQDDGGTTAIKVENDEEDRGVETVVDFVTKRKRLYDVASLVMPYLLGPSILQVEVTDPSLPEREESETEGSETEESETEVSEIAGSEIEGLINDTTDIGPPDGRQEAHGTVSHYRKASNHTKAPIYSTASDYPEVFPLLPIGLSATPKLLDIALRSFYPQTAFTFYFNMLKKAVPDPKHMIRWVNAKRYRECAYSITAVLDFRPTPSLADIRFRVPHFPMELNIILKFIANSARKTVSMDEIRHRVSRLRCREKKPPGFCVVDGYGQPRDYALTFGKLDDYHSASWRIRSTDME